MAFYTYHACDIITNSLTSDETSNFAMTMIAYMVYDVMDSWQQFNWKCSEMIILLWVQRGELSLVKIYSPVGYFYHRMGSPFL